MACHETAKWHATEPQNSQHGMPQNRKMACHETTKLMKWHATFRLLPITQHPLIEQ
jgi:hypothetical protein